VITSNGSTRDSDAKGVGNVSGRKVDDSHMRAAAGSSVLFGTGVALEDRVVRPVAAADAARGRLPVVSEPVRCPGGRPEVPSLVHLVLSLAVLCFAVAISVL
jgi:hypothetical protein